MRNQSNALADFITGKIDAAQLAKNSLDYAAMYVDPLKSPDIDHIVAEVRDQAYELQALSSLQNNGIMETEQHFALARWYFEFCLKLYLMGQIGDMAQRLSQVQDALMSGPVVTLSELTDSFNVVVDGSRIEQAASYRMEVPKTEVSTYYFEASKQYKRKGLTGARQ